MRAYQRRRRGAPEADYGVRITAPVVMQPEIIDDPDDLPASWRVAAESTQPSFVFDGMELRVMTDEQGVPWFVAADVCGALDLPDTHKAVSRLDDDERSTTAIHTPGGVQSMTTVNEPGLYSLILGSRKPEAKRFKRWVTHEVLPAIRRTGRYAMLGAQAAPQPRQLPEGIHISAATRQQAAEIWWKAVQSELQGALARRLDPRYRPEAVLARSQAYMWHQPALTVLP